jgi:hypothetical protein
MAVQEVVREHWGVETVSFHTGTTGPHEYLITPALGIGVGKPSSVGRKGRKRSAGGRLEEHARLAGP